MTREQLIARITKKEEDIKKIEKRIAKWSKGLRPEDINVCKPLEQYTYSSNKDKYMEVLNDVRNYIKQNVGSIPKSDDWNKGPNIQELYGAYIDLGEAKSTLSKYQTSLTKLDNYEKEEKVEVLWNFLLNWKEIARKYFHENCELFFNLKKDYVEAKKTWEESWKDSHNSDKIPYYLHGMFDKEYYSSVSSLTTKIIHIDYKAKNNDYYSYSTVYIPTSYTIDEKLLEEYLTKEVHAKYKDLVNRITEKAGEIMDASNLYIRAGQINGVIKGSKNNVYVQTFSAEGPVQCFHYRTRVDIIK